MGKSQRIADGRFIIRPYQEVDQPGVLALWREVFGQEMPASLWHWKYTANPYGRRIMLCVQDTGEIVAYFGGIPYSANCNGRRVEIVQLMDIMSHPQYRGGGFFVQTAQAFTENCMGIEKYAFCYGLPGKQHFDIGEKYLQYRRLPEGMAYVTASTDDAEFFSTCKQASALTYSQIDGAFDRLWEKCRPYYPMAVVRNQQFVKWRFCENCLKDYEIWGYYNTPQTVMEGYAVICNEGDRAVIVDWLSMPKPETVKSFLSCLKQAYKTKGVKHMVTWLPAHHALADIFLGAGFTNEPEPFGFIPAACCFAPEISPDWVLNNLYYTMADGDLF
ncbi:MAG: GNAT family N-acetyltransferase [Desulfobacterales bacterium]|nr:GNAT family N-acetyltransferase [Desulfobacterales bacterium]